MIGTQITIAIDPDVHYGETRATVTLRAINPTGTLTVKFSDGSASVVPVKDVRGTRALKAALRDRIAQAKAEVEAASIAQATEADDDEIEEIEVIEADTLNVDDEIDVTITWPGGSKVFKRVCVERVETLGGVCRVTVYDSATDQTFAVTRAEVTAIH